ncbi:MAG: potassium transporter Kup [Chitinivorax sp.]
MQTGVSKQPLAALTLGAIGVVYGDIGTSPLYTIKECFTGHSIPLITENIFGIMSLIFWSVLLVVSLKYVIFILRADNNGEGGILALMSLVLRTLEKNPRGKWYVMLGGVFGASLFYGDGMITPAISVLSAVEGLGLIAPALQHYIIPATIVILVMLFTLQRQGTHQVGKLFAPIMLLWFSTLGVLGALSISQTPEILQAMNPRYGVVFVFEHRWEAFLVLGSVVLALTGAEALYADMGHFGRTPIRLAWFSFVLPALLLNYFGQCALLMRQPDAAHNPFYLLAPNWALVPMVILSTAAAIIASQAVISGAFSLTRQAVQLGYLPRLEILHTSEKEIGQIYIPAVNWMLLVAIILLVLGFRNSGNLAAAYGIAVTGTMLASTVLAFILVKNTWRWPLWACVLMLSFFLSLDLAFFSANAMKILDGGWFPLMAGFLLFTLLTTWKRGRQILFERLSADSLPLEGFVKSLEAYPPTRVPGTAIFMTSTSEGVPHALLHNLKHNKILHERVVFLNIFTEDIPFVPDIDRIQVRQLGDSFHFVTASYGFKEAPDMPEILEACGQLGLKMDMMDTSFFLSRETLIPSKMPGMALWREKIFSLMSRNAMRATDFFKIPTNRVVELGTQVEI